MAPKSTEKTAATTAVTAPTKDPKKDKDPEPELSEEDAALKERLDTCVSTLLSAEADVTTELRLKSLDIIVDELRQATSSMTSVPKPLKFLRGHWLELKGYYKGGTLGEGADAVFLKARLGDVLAVLAMTMGDRGEFLACDLC
jgi:26S proteasome regulatory subunit N1